MILIKNLKSAILAKKIENIHFFHFLKNMKKVDKNFFL